MEGREFSEKIRCLQDQVAELQRASSQDEREQLEGVLRNTLEELHVADEELRQQNEELMAVRQALETERQHYLNLFDFAPDGYLKTDFEGMIQEANYAAAVLFNGGRPMGEAASPRLRDVEGGADGLTPGCGGRSGLRQS